MKKISRMKLGLLYILSSVVISVILGIVFSVFISRGDFLGTILKVSTYIYFILFCSCTVSGILLMITKLPEDLTFGFGIVLYYGTGLLTYFLMEIGGCDSGISFLVSLVVVSLILYIVWEKMFKWKYEK